MTSPTHLFNVPRAAWPTTIVDALVGLYCALFRKRIRAVYLLGSRAEGSAATVSDIDGIVLFKDAFVDEREAALAQEVLRHCQQISPLRLDISVWAEDDERLQQGRDIRLKLGGELVFGEDIRDQLPLPSIEAYQAYLREWVHVFLCRLHDKEPDDPNALVPPLVYPDAADHFFGYARKRAIPWYPANVKTGTKEFVATVCWVATALLAHDAGVFVPTRSACVELARQHLPTETADFVGTVYQKCKVAWDYALPTQEADRQQLRQLCADAPGFFNRYLERTRPA